MTRYDDIAPGQFSVLNTERETGKLLTEDGERANSDQIFRRVFDSLEDAERFCAERLTSRPETEWVILDHRGSTAKTVIDEAHWRSRSSSRRPGWIERLYRRLIRRSRE